MGTLALPVPSASAQFHRHPSHQRSECRRACHLHPAGLKPLALKTCCWTFWSSALLTTH